MSLPTLKNWPTVVLLGDSLTQVLQGYSKDGHWVSYLSDKLQRKCDVINRGLGGYNSRWYNLILSQLLNKQQDRDVATCVIFLGANDATLPNCILHVPCEEYKRNLLEMIRYLNSIGVDNSKIILISTPPCDEDKLKHSDLQQGKPVSQRNDYKRQYATACEDAASQSGCVFIDAYNKFMEQENWKDMFTDGLHFSSKGAHFFSTLLWPHVKALTQHLEIIGPIWNEVDYNNPQNSFTFSSEDTKANA